ncbi:general transcription factor II-I repeat domain-containing protein 2-like, partial [Ctenocephalides felis]
MESKKQKLDVRGFQDCWTNEYGFIQQKDRAVCAICRESVVCRTSSVQRHFQTKHQSTFNSNDEKCETIKKAVSCYKKQITFFCGMTGTKAKATECSFAIAHCIAAKGKPFTDGEYIKEFFIKSAEKLFSDLPNQQTILSRIQEIPASARTIERRITEMADNVTTKQNAGLQEAVSFSVAVDESTDVNDIARLAVFARYCDKDQVYEELCTLIPLSGTTKGEDILSSFISYFDSKNINVKKIFSVTTDGAAAMIGKDRGFVKLLENHIGHKILNFHCIIHQESLVAKISSQRLIPVMNTVVKIVNFIVSRSSLTHRQFKSLVEEMESEYVDLPSYSHVRWLSRGNVLNKFVSCLEPIKVFLNEKEQHFPELNDEEWLGKLMFLTDVTNHLNELNLKLQGKRQTVLELFEYWTAFASKLNIFLRDINTSTYKYFPNVRALANESTVNNNELKTYVEALKDEFCKRCKDFEAYVPIFSFLIQPDLDSSTIPFDCPIFEWMNVDNFEMEIIELTSSELWKTKFKELRKNLEDDSIEKST